MESTKLIRTLAVLLVTVVSALAETRSLQINGTTGRILGVSSVKIPSGMTLEIESGGSLLATSINGLTITSSTGTLSITNGKTLAATNSVTLAGTDGSSLNIGAGGTLGSAAFTASSAYQPVGSYKIDDARFRSLTSMALVKTVSSIVGVSSGISGATYNPRSGTVFVVRNQSGAAGTIYELTIDGALIRTITNSNFIDTEAIEWVGYDAGDGAACFWA